MDTVEKVFLGVCIAIVVFMLGGVVLIVVYSEDERKVCRDSGGIVYNTKDGKSFVCVNPKDFLPERE